MANSLLEHRRPRKSSRYLPVCCIYRSARPTGAPRPKSEVPQAAHVLLPWEHRQRHVPAKVPGAGHL